MSELNRRSLIVGGVAAAGALAVPAPGGASTGHGAAAPVGRSSGGVLNGVANRVREQVAAYCQQSGIPGYVAGIYHDGAQALVSHGLANTVTGAPMRQDTGFLFGSVTKVLTTTLVLRQVERGLIDLDARLNRYLPQLRLKTPAAGERTRVRHLLNHTNGIDADLFFPDVNGPDALRVYAEGMRGCGTFFTPGEYISYSNGGMNIAGRLLEVVTGVSYHDLLQRELYATVGMDGSCTSADQAILRNTAIGHFPDPATMAAKRTTMFKLPDTWAPAGASAIGTIGDMLAFARTHLANGVSPSGTRVLSGELTALMQAVSHDMATPSVPPLGLGWLLMPFGNTTVLTMTGASPGGVSILAVVPEHDFVFAAFGNDTRALMLHDQILLWLLGQHLGIRLPDLISGTSPVEDLTPYVGTYRSNQLRVDVRAVAGQLEETITYEPADPVQERIFTQFAGGTVQAPPRRYLPIRNNLFAPAGLPLQAFNGYLRQLLVSYHGVQADGAMYRCAGGRMTRHEHHR